MSLSSYNWECGHEPQASLKPSGLNRHIYEGERAMIFVDESIHSDLDLICVSFVYSPEDPASEINRVLKHAGLEPGHDEYKSGVQMFGKPHLHALRESIGSIALGCKFAVYVAPLSELSSLQSSVVRIAHEIVQANALPTPQYLFIDEGMVGGYVADATQLIVYRGCDSKQVRGVQLADYLAYHCALLLKTHITGNVKTIKLDDTPHPLAGEDVALDWMVRTDMRRSFFHEPRDFESIEGDDFFFKVSGYGFFSSSKLNAAVRDAAHQAFQEVYLGCVW